MCGIAGFVETRSHRRNGGARLDRAALERAVLSLHHRGPDGHGTFVSDDGRAGLGHARLSIVDLTTGAQPLYSENRDLALVCNGEIYDDAEWRRELEGRGHVFSSASDSEVIIHLYEEHGAECVELLRGEFAFLLYDRQKQLVLAARDRFGIKPLFFNRQHDRVVFGSEAKAIFATRALRPALDVTALRDYFTGVLPDSIFEGVEAVPPGCWMTVRVGDGACNVQRYWDIDLPAEQGPAEPAPAESDDAQIAAVRAAVEDAVRLRLRADVPVGVYLSGGLDSAIVASTMKRLHAGPLKAFSISFPGGAAFDELAIAQRTAAHIGVDLHVATCDERALAANAEAFLWVAEQPFVNFHGVGKFILSQLAKRQVTVVLTGEGADEVFLGYAYFKDACPPLAPGEAAIVEDLGFRPQYNQLRALSPGSQRWRRWFFNARHRARLAATTPRARLKARVRRELTAGRSHLRQLQTFSIRALLATYLLTILGDRPEMGHAIEGRPPFLDHKLFERARQVPDHLKIRNGVEKYVLREAFKGDVPAEIHARAKWAYFAPAMPVTKGMSREMDDLLDRHLTRRAITQAGVFNANAIGLLRSIRRLLPTGWRITSAIDTVLAFTLTVQVLSHQYVDNFDAELQTREAGSGPT